jgi:hypothetical protein
MSIISIYDTDAKDLENLLMSEVKVGDADELHNGLIVAVKLIRALQEQIRDLNESVNALRQIIVSKDESK